MKKEEAKNQLTIAILQDVKVKNLETNYYKEWLEEKTGIKIQFEYIPNDYEEEYIKACLTTETSGIDAMFFTRNQKLLSIDELNEYGKQGYIADITSYITEDTYLKQAMSKYKEQNLDKMLLVEKSLYYMPGMDTSRKQQNLQILWINKEWLKQLGMQIPKTTEELKEVLLAFRDQDPNGNGIADEVPLISCEESYSMQSYNYILNAYTKNDPQQMRLYEEDGRIKTAAIEDAFREGLIFCNNLYQEGLLEKSCFTFSQKQIMELVNSKENLVGAFTSKSISDIMYANGADVIANYIQVPPLTGAEGEKNAVWTGLEPRIGGIVLANSEHAKEAFLLMDFMLSEEAALIAEYGEENVDWKWSNSGDLSTYGTRAKITTIQYLNDSLQNKNFAGAGPQIVDETYVNGVTWNGDNSLIEYIDVRAVRTYEDYYFTTENLLYKNGINVNGAVYESVKKWLDKKICKFVTGELDVSSDEIWNAYIQEYKENIKAWDKEVRQ